MESRPKNSIAERHCLKENLSKQINLKYYHPMITNNNLSKCNWKNEVGFYSLGHQSASIAGSAGDTSTQNYASRTVSSGEPEKFILKFSGSAGGFGGDITISRWLPGIGPGRYLLTKTLYQPGKNPEGETFFPGVPVGYLILPEETREGTWVELCKTDDGLTVEIFIHRDKAEIRFAESRHQRWGLL